MENKFFSEMIRYINAQHELDDLQLKIKNLNFTKNYLKSEIVRIDKLLDITHSDVPIAKMVLLQLNPQN
jgi:hypothetical protein